MSVSQPSLVTSGLKKYHDCDAQARGFTVGNHYPMVGFGHPLFTGCGPWLHHNLAPFALSLMSWPCLPPEKHNIGRKALQRSCSVAQTRTTSCLHICASAQRTAEVGGDQSISPFWQTAARNLEDDVDDCEPFISVKESAS